MTTYRLVAFDTKGTKVAQADLEASSPRDAFDKGPLVDYTGHDVTCEINRGETMFTFPDGRSVLVSVVR